MDAVHVEPGDLILVKSRGRAFGFGRWATGSPYDHIAVVATGGETVNIDKPMTRRLPIARLLRDAYEPLVLRPVWEDATARDAFVRWIESLVATQYDVHRTLRLLPRLLLQRFFRVSVPLEAPRRDQARWICTDAVLLGLEAHAKGFHAVEALPLDWYRLRCGTTNDFLTVSGRRPDLLARVTK